MSPLPNRCFYIAGGVGIKAPYQPYVLGIEGANKAPGMPVISWPMGVSDASQIWTMTGDGHILSQLNGCALAWDDTHGRLATANCGDPAFPNQLWSVTADGYVENQLLGDEVITWTSSGVSLAPRWSNDPGHFQNWTLVAPTPPAGGNTPGAAWVYFRSALQDAEGTSCVFNVQGGSTAPGTNVIVWPLGDVVGNNELWQITPDGRILSAQGNGLVLTLGAPCGEGGNHVTVDKQKDPLPLTQLWDLSTPNQIRSVFSGEFVVPAGGTEGPITLDGQDLLTAPGTPSSSYTWYTVPPSSLKDVMAQSPVPFPEFTGDESDAYDCIVTRLGITSLRAEYYDLDNTLSDFGSQIASWAQAPDGIPQDAWDTVRDQLLTEIRYADTARNLFVNYQTFHLALYVDHGVLLNELISDAGIVQGDSEPQVGGIGLSVMEGLAYTALSAAPEAFPVVGNLMEMGVNIALAASSGAGSISPDPFQVTVSELWKELSDDFDALLISMGNAELAILQDWGKLQRVHQLTQPQQGEGDPLYWDPNTTATLVNAARSGYIISVMQVLLPAKYQIYTTHNGYCPDDCPASAKWQSGEVMYWIAGRTNPFEYPAEAMQKDIWANGVRQVDFFQSNAGWAFPAASDEVGDGDSNATVTFNNLTPNMLRLTLDAPTATTDVWPYQSICLVLAPSRRHQATTWDFQIVDVDSGLNQAATFTVQTDWPIAQAMSIAVTASNAGSGYRLTPPVCNTEIGLYHNGKEYMGAAAQIGLIQT